MATAIDMYLRQIILTGGIPFALSLPKVPAALNTDNMTVPEIHAVLQAGYDDIGAGNVKNASTAFATFRDSHR
jgi:antitoxin component of RelBE/YafQ-DinJ toxin-antitoxin module